ncbi:hypothetical protein KQX54_012536 [Cotesia glomerata]|uniref:Uncharacterized protein n=1 Tax=Cotesia glomerata TaxID=32391 RepID=A0AAV7HXU1_COTGL|nr:hypothetical protein KQX54_012536 [Cotesia glomerata]
MVARSFPRAYQDKLKTEEMICIIERHPNTNLGLSPKRDVGLIPIFSCGPDSRFVEPLCTEEVIKVSILLENPSLGLSVTILESCIFFTEQNSEENSETEQASVPE